MANLALAGPQRGAESTDHDEYLVEIRHLVATAQGWHAEAAQDNGGREAEGRPPVVLVDAGQRGAEALQPEHLVVGGRVEIFVTAGGE